MKRNMSNSEELKNRITNWIIEEGLTYSQIPNENCDFQVRLTFGFVIDLLKGKEYQRILSTSRITFQDNNIVKAFSKLTKKQRLDFFYDLEIELAKFPIGYDIEPNDSSKLDSITFNRLTYLEDITKTALFCSFDTIRRAMLFTNIFASNRLEINLTESTDERKAGVG